MLHFLPLLALITRVAALWPVPRSIYTGSSALRLSNSFDISLNVKDAPSDLKAAVSESKKFLTNDKLERLVVGRGESDRATISAAKVLKTLTVSLQPGAEVKSIAMEAVVDVAQRSEGYQLEIPSDGTNAKLTANSTLGLFRGLTTYTQLWYELDGMTYTLQAPMSITDSPAYPYRGFMLDTARNFFPVSDIKRLIQASSWVKLNQFHWHIVDSQSFPLVVNNFPELSKAGAYSQTSVYTEEDVDDIVSFAGAHGVDVMLEIDTPGHTAVIAESHPEFVACANAKPWPQFANEPPAGQLRFASPAVANFTASLFKSVASKLTSKLFSTGGDEININCYTHDTETQRLLASSGQTLEQALDKFTQTTHATLKDLDKTPVVWEEMVLAHNVTLSNDTIAMVWISSQNVASVTTKGFRVVHAASDFFYLDCGAGGWVGGNVNGNSWCEPFKTWQKAYSFDPLANITTEEQVLILGGEQLLWTEQSGPENVDSIVWPRAAASAEVFWTGANLPDGSPRNVKEALARLHDVRYRMVKRGVHAINLQPHWCALRPHACDLM